MSDIAYTARIQYEHGVDPIDWAIEQTRITIDAREFRSGGTCHESRARAVVRA